MEFICFFRVSNEGFLMWIFAKLCTRGMGKFKQKIFKKIYFMKFCIFKYLFPLMFCQIATRVRSRQVRNTKKLKAFRARFFVDFQNEMPDEQLLITKMTGNRQIIFDI